MGFILQLIINAAIIFIAAYFLPKIEIKNIGNALLVALLLGILNPTIGLLLRFIFHIGTLGIPLLLGLGFLIRLIVTAIILKLIDAFMPGFRIVGFKMAILLAIIIAVAGTLLNWLFL